MVSITNRDWRRIRKTLNRLANRYEDFKRTLENQDAVEDALYHLYSLLDKYQIKEQRPEEHTDDNQ